MQPGLVTVMIPSYNYARFLRECVESAAGQSNVDVVIVDNGSTDESPELGEQLARRHRNVRFVRYHDNQGIITSFNRCRNEVRGEYAVLLCADDCLTPGSIERSRQFMAVHPGVGLVYGPATFFLRLDDLRPDELEGEVRPPVVYRGDRWIERLCRTGLNPIYTPEAFARSAVLEKVGGYEPRTPYTSDLNLWLRVAAVSDIGFIPGPSQALFRRHGENEGTAYPHASAAELTARWAAYETFFEWLGDDERRGEWEPLARRRLASDARYAASRAFPHEDPADGEVERLLDLAAEIDPADPLGDRLGWRVRRALGPRWSARFPGFYVRPVAHRLERMRDDHRRRRTGVA
jgi:glycosyltransferase involved in cell wall biosynthesis